MPGRRPFARPRMIVFALNGRVASRGVAVLCVDDLQGTESFTTPFRSVSESSALESYGIFRACVLSVRLPAIRLILHLIRQGCVVIALADCSRIGQPLVCDARQGR